MNFTEYFLAYWHVWLTEAAVLTLAAAIIFTQWRRISKMAVSHMMSCALVIWLAGVALYSIGFAYEGSGKSLVAFFLRSAQASLEMFISENELIEVSPYYKENALYMGIFALVHFCALMLSAMLILNTIGFRLKHFFLVSMEALTSKKDVTTFVFWGFSDQSICMARDIRSRHPDARLVFIRSTGDIETSEKIEVSEMVNTWNSQNKSLNTIRIVDSIEDALVVYTSVDIKGINETEDILESLRLSNLRRILDRTTEINYMVFTHDQGFNAKLGSLFFMDRRISRAPGKKVSIYTLSSHGGKNRILEEYIMLSRSDANAPRWTLVDQSFLSVEALKSIPACHPVMSIHADDIRNGAVDSSFMALVVGFGETGIEMYKYLYEFGSFIGSDGAPAKKKIIIADKDIDRIAGPMCISSPGIFHTDSVELVAHNPGTVEFWRAVRQYADRINCICVSMGDDVLDIDFTIDMYRAILQYFVERPKDIKIFLRIYSHDNEATIRRLADNYNRHRNETGIEIIPFGSVSDVFNCDVIMQNDMLASARTFNHRFDMLRGRNLDCSADEAWARDYNVSKYMERYKSTPLVLEEITRRAVQCHLDTLHIGTILRLAGIDAADSEALSDFAAIVESRPGDSTSYAAATPEQQKLMDTLARTAHARVLASHWLMGYRPTDFETLEKNPVDAARQRLSPYMKPWEETSQEIRLQAYTVVDTSILIALQQASWPEDRLL